MTKRLFIAIPISEELKKLFSDFAQEYQHPQIRWIPAANLHITVNFLGDTDVQSIPQITEELKKIISQQQGAGFALKFDRILFAPPQRVPSMVWAQYANCPEYTKLIKKIAGITHGRFQHKDTIPHITLARFRPAPREERGRNWHTIKDLKLHQRDPNKMELEVSQIQLMESELTRNGAIYSILEKYNL